MPSHRKRIFQGKRACDMRRRDLAGAVTDNGVGRDTGPGKKPRQPDLQSH